MASDEAIEPVTDPVVAESSVSMSPESLEQHVPVIGPGSHAAMAAETSPGVALTRAASRAQIAEMSPVTWLANFGPVIVGRPN